MAAEFIDRDDAKADVLNFLVRILQQSWLSEFPIMVQVPYAHQVLPHYR